MLNVIMLNVIMLSVVMLSVVAPITGLVFRKLLTDLIFYGLNILVYKNIMHGSLTIILRQGALTKQG